MKSSEVKELFRQLTEKFFSDATVVFAKQSRIAKPELKLVTIATGNITRPLSPVYEIQKGYLVGKYLSKLPVTVDLFSHGRPYKDKTSGKILFYENDALEEITGFGNFVNSEDTVQWSYLNDVTLLINGEIIDVSELVNDNTYEYRARINIDIYFTENAFGSDGMSDSLKEAEDKAEGTGWFEDAEITDITDKEE